MIYRWKDAAPIHIEAQVAGEELERIRVRHNGRLEPAMVVDASRPEDAPLHDAFEWDDRIAAENYRGHQASHMIRSIVVQVTPADDAPPIRAFVSVRRDEDRSYTSVAHAMSDPTLRAQIVAEALKELDAWRKRHAELVELARIFAGIDQARSGQ